MIPIHLWSTSPPWIPPESAQHFLPRRWLNRRVPSTTAASASQPLGVQGEPTSGVLRYKISKPKSHHHDNHVRKVIHQPYGLMVYTHKNGEIGGGKRGKSFNPLLNRAGANTPGPRQRGGGCGELRAEAAGQGGGCLPLGKRLGG